MMKSVPEGGSAPEEGGGLRALPSSTVRLIASAQVITSVVSVVKELVENSLDARASSIDIKLDDFGFSKIEVRDNGSGIRPSDAPYMAQPHYTSKITSSEDLAQLHTYGFRGEALGSLCVVSDVTITTKTCNDDVSITYSVDHKGHITDTKPSHLGQGTTVAASGLFRNLPVRKQFYGSLAKKKEELKKVEDLVLAFGVICCQVRLSLRHNREVLWQKSSVADHRSVLLSVWGSVALNNMQHLKRKSLDPEFEFEAFLPTPGADSQLISRTNSSRSYVFVNKRPVIMKEVDKLLKKAYEKAFQVENGRHPLAFIHLVVPPNGVDVNLEPNKNRVMLTKKEEILEHIDSVLQEIYRLNSSNNNTDITADDANKLTKNQLANDALGSGQGESNPRSDDQGESSKCVMDNCQLSPLFGDVGDLPMTTQCVNFDLWDNIDDLDLSSVLTPNAKSTHIPGKSSRMGRPSLQKNTNDTACEHRAVHHFVSTSAGSLFGSENEQIDIRHASGPDAILNDRHGQGESVKQENMDVAWEFCGGDGTMSSVETSLRGQVSKEDWLTSGEQRLDPSMSTKNSTKMSSHVQDPQGGALWCSGGETSSRLSMSCSSGDGGRVPLGDDNTGADRTSESTDGSSKQNLDKLSDDALYSGPPSDYVSAGSGTELSTVTRTLQGSVQEDADFPDISSRGAQCRDEGGGASGLSGEDIPVVGSGPGRPSSVNDTAQWSKGLALVDSTGKHVEPVKLHMPGAGPSTSSPALATAKAAATKRKSIEDSPGQAKLYDLIGSCPIKRPTTAYIYFSKEIRPQVVAQHPTASFEDVARFIGERWKALSADEKQKYEQLMTKDVTRYRAQVSQSMLHNVTGQSGTTTTPRLRNVNKRRKLEQGNQSILLPKKLKTPMKASAARDDRVKVVNVQFSMKSLKIGLNKGMMSTQAWIGPDESMKLIGRLKTAWLGLQDNRIVLFHPIRAQEELMYRKMLESHALALEVLPTAIAVSMETLGDELVRLLRRMQKNAAPQLPDPHTYYTDVRLTSSGLGLREIWDSKGNSNKIEIVSKATCLSISGLAELREILSSLRMDESAPVSRTRPSKVRHYIQGEAVRIARQLPPQFSRDEVVDLLAQVMQELPPGTKSCFHNRPIFHSLYGMADLPETQHSSPTEPHNATPL